MIHDTGIVNLRQDLDDIMKENPSLSIDGWTDVSKANIYGFILQTTNRSALVKNRFSICDEAFQRSDGGKLSSYYHSSLLCPCY